MTIPTIRLCVGCGERPARPDRRRCNGCSSTYVARKRMTQHAGESTIPCPYCGVAYNQHTVCAACGCVVGPDHSRRLVPVLGICYECCAARERREQLARGLL